MSNRNIRTATLIAEEFALAGLKHICFAPGSRNTPLVLAFAAQENMRIYSHLDERSASFFALGLAMATREPVALLCTSGSAVGNFFPAVIEAHQSRVPLIVLSADRPHELRGSGANQTIDQVDILGKYALWAVDLPLPEANSPEIAVRYLRTTVNRAVAIANGKRKGVVHLNIPFRKPLEPMPVEGDTTENPPRLRGTNQSYVTYIDSTPEPDIQLFMTIRQQYTRGIIVAGVNAVPAGDHAAREAIFQLGAYTGYPIFADVLSGMRFGRRSEAVISTYETFLQKPDVPTPDVIIRVGNVPTAKWLNAFIAKAKPAVYMHVSEDGVWSDDSHLITHFVNADIRRLRHLLPIDSRQTDYDATIVTLETTTRRKLANLEQFDAAYVQAIFALAPQSSRIFMGNSSPIRHADQFALSQNKRLDVYGNRGASGIDGNVSTALGIGAADTAKPMIVIVGDITFYHDMNGLLAARRCGVPITIVVLNNNGGGIFRRLPIGDYDPDFTNYFLTPHDLDFSHAAAMYGFDFHRVTERGAFKEIFTNAIAAHSYTIIEVITDSQQDIAVLREIVR